MGNVSLPEGPYFEPESRRSIPHFGIATTPPPAGLNFDQNPGNSQPLLAKKMGGHFGDTCDVRCFPQNPGESWAMYHRLRVPISNTNREEEFPISASPPPLVQRALILTKIPAIISRYQLKKGGPFGDTWGARDFPRNLRNRGQCIIA